MKFEEITKRYFKTTRDHDFWWNERITDEIVSEIYFYNKFKCEKHDEVYKWAEYICYGNLTIVCETDDIKDVELDLVIRSLESFEQPVKHKG